MNPIVFEAPTSPHIISEKVGLPIDFSVMTNGLKHLQSKAQWVLVEGAGGWYTPLSAQQSYADWVVEQQLPVIMVVGIKLGCINHALLTAQAINQSGLKLVGWVANEVEPAGTYQAEYIETLHRSINAPCLGIIPHQDAEQFADVGKYVDVTAI